MNSQSLKKVAGYVLAVTLLAAVGTMAAEAQDVVGDWTLISEKAVKAGGHPLPVTSLEFAMVQLAIYDAVVSIDRRYEPYYALVPNATGSLAAAVAGAGRDVLIGLFPTQSASIDADYQNFLATHFINPSDPGIAVGAQAAANILALRSNDGRFPSNPQPYLGSDAIGQWRPTPSFLLGPPPSFAPGLTPWLVNVRPFTLQSNSQFRVDPPPELTSDTWANDYNEVNQLGSLTSTTRTYEQTEIGYFWLPSGPLLWQSAMRDISGKYLNNVADSARMFALVDTAMADAAIACWESKYFYNAWRPITAIRLGDQDENAATDPDPDWQPLINTPNFPEYPSGHTSVSGAASRVLQLLFGTDVLPFQMTSERLQKSRTFVRFSDAEEEVIEARIYVGIHFRTSDRAGRSQGLRLANWVFKNFFRPVGEPRFGAQ